MRRPQLVIADNHVTLADETSDALERVDPGLRESCGKVDSSCAGTEAVNGRPKHRSAG